MSALAEKERLANNALALRGIEMSLPDRERVAAVRADLERLAGPTITRAMAARLLGVSQPALDEWVSRGEIPIVMSPGGRRELPLTAVLELAAAVGSHRLANPGERYPLASVLQQRIQDAARLDRDAVLPLRHRRSAPNGHRRAELRGLAYHRAVAQRLDLSMVADARRRLAEWRSEGKIAERYARAWERVLSAPLSRIASAIAADSAAARDLRQNSPFAGALTEQERRRVIELTKS